jgi:hypothetical protein
MTPRTIKNQNQRSLGLFALRKAQLVNHKANKLPMAEVTRKYVIA